MQKYPHIIESFACILLNIFCDIFVADEFFNFFWNIFNPKAIQMCCIINIQVQS